MVSYKSIPNSVSVLRMVLALFFVVIVHDIFVYGCTSNLLLTITFSAIIATDVADGYLARKLKCTSSAGAKLDIVADSVYVILSLAVFAYFQVISAWFVLVIVLKLIEFAITSRIMRGRRRTESALFFDRLGKTAICTVMLLPGMFVFRCVIVDYTLVMNMMVYALTAMIVVSSCKRVAEIFRTRKV
jgi:CDP-diacylglycerol--glycerol-3-phosphate 3-phosphatidyltransferase